VQHARSAPSSPAGILRGWGTSQKPQRTLYTGDDHSENSNEEISEMQSKEEHQAEDRNDDLARAGEIGMFDYTSPVSAIEQLES
jgi:hypothetical protein